MPHEGKGRKPPPRRGLYWRLTERLWKDGLTRLQKRFPFSPITPTLSAFYRPEERGKVLLDFGCGSARFLDQARLLGWETWGADFSRAAVEGAAAAGHHAVLLDNEEAWARLPPTLDFIRISHVLEHLYSPREMLERLVARMPAGGKLHIAIPNPRSISFFLFRSFWFPREAPRHIMLYTPEFLERFLRGLGLQKIQVLHESDTKDGARSLAYFLQRWHLLGEHEMRALIGRPDFAALLHLPIYFSAKKGRTDRFHLLAQK